MAKHLTHAIPTALMGVPGDTMATPMMRARKLPKTFGNAAYRIAENDLRWDHRGVYRLPVTLVFAWVLSPFGSFFQQNSGIIFTIAGSSAYLSKGALGERIAHPSHGDVVSGLDALSFTNLEKHLSISFFLRIAIGPMLVDLLIALSKAPGHRLPSKK